MTLFLLRVKNSAKIPCFARYLAGLIIQRGSRRGRRRMAQRGRRGNDKLLYLRTQPRDTGGTPRYRYPKFTSSTRKIFRENFIARISRERGSSRSVIHFASTNLEKVILSALAPVVYSQTHSVNAPGTLISSFLLKPARPMQSDNKIFLSF